MHALGPHACVTHDDVAAETVADEAHRLVASESIEQRLEIGDVVVEPIALRLPCRASEAAHVRCDRIPIACKRIDEELKRRAHVHPAVQQEERRGLRPTPRHHMMALAAHVDEMRRRRLEHLLHDGSSERYFLRQSARPSCQPVR